MIFDTISVKARWERWCRWNCDLKVINARLKKKGRHFLLYRKRRHDVKSRDHMPTTSLGSGCKMANSSSENETVPTRIQPNQFEPVRHDFEKVPGKIQGDGRKFLDRFKSYFGSQILSQSLNEIHIYWLQAKFATKDELFFFSPRYFWLFLSVRFGACCLLTFDLVFQ